MEAKQEHYVLLDQTIFMKLQIQLGSDLYAYSISTKLSVPRERIDGMK